MHKYLHGARWRAVAAALAVTTLLIGAAPATASAATVPSCVATTLNDEGYTDYLTVTNWCSYDVRVKVVLANHSDLACEYYLVGRR